VRGSGADQVQPDVEPRAGVGRRRHDDALAEGPPLVGAHVVWRVQRRQLPRQAQVAVHRHERPARKQPKFAEDGSDTRYLFIHGMSALPAERAA